MRSLSKNRNKRIIAVGAHPDDIELGCGAALAYYVHQEYDIQCVVLTRGEKTGGPSERVEETKRALKLLGVSQVFFGQFADTEIPNNHSTIEFLEKYSQLIRPQIAFIPSQNEIHQDHKTAAMVAMTAFRSIPRVLSYESPTTTQWFRPRFYVHVTRYIEKKGKLYYVIKHKGVKHICNTREC